MHFEIYEFCDFELANKNLNWNPIFSSFYNYDNFILLSTPGVKHDE